MTRQDRAAESEPRWLLLIHQLPPKPAYLRVRIGRRLAALGAVAIKNTVYALPRTETSQEDLAWVLREIGEAGGEAVLGAAPLLAGPGAEQVESLFQAARSGDYARIAERTAKLDGSLRKRASLPPRAAAGRRALRGAAR